MNNLESTTTLKYDAVGSDVDFVTLITIENSDGQIMDINSINFDNDKYSFSVSKVTERNSALI